MSRHKQNRRNPIIPDYRHNDVDISLFINKVMRDGKKTIAQRIVYNVLERLSKETGESEVKSFHEVMKRLAPLIEVKSRRVGGSTYQVPVEVQPRRGLALAMRWLIENSRSKKGISMSDALAKEMIDAYNGVGASMKKREDTHKMAQANKAFAHYRW